MLGRYLVAKGLLTEEQLQRALQRQLQLRSAGEPRMLGDILMQMGVITPEQLHAALRDPQRVLLP